MDKVLVDRELLEQIVNTNMGDYALIALQHKEILAILAQPADAEVVQRYCFDQTGCDVADNEGPWVSYDDHIAALSAVTAERDRLREQVAALQSDANSWQSGYDKGREDGAKSAGGWKEQHARDSAELRRLCKERDQTKADRKACWEEFKAMVKSSSEKERYMQDEIDQLRAEVEALRTVVAQSVEYLDVSSMESICSGSVIHQRLRAAMAAKEG